MKAPTPEQMAARSPALHRSYIMPVQQVLDELRTSAHGLDIDDAAERLTRFGRNYLPQKAGSSWFVIFLRQFHNPLIYVLLIAAIVSFLLTEWADGGFIIAVLLINALIGTMQEASAERSAIDLQSLVTMHARVLRAGDSYEINADELVPGDIVLLESGDKVPADLRLVSCHAIEVDESLLTGESEAVGKQTAALSDPDLVIGDRDNMVFAGTLIARGRAHGVVVATGYGTELGQLAQAVLEAHVAKPPLLLRMERFTTRIAIMVGITILLLAGASLLRGDPLAHVFLLSVALAVSAIPEGLPVAITVALAVGMRRMAKRNVIVRKLVAVEALGSCTFIASDKTGTLTLNELTARRVMIPGMPALEVSGEGTIPEGTISAHSEHDADLVRELCTCCVLANEAVLAHRDDSWVHHGDSVDVALLVLAHKAGIIAAEALNECPQLEQIAFEPESRFSASLNRVGNNKVAYVKGAWETVSGMCDCMMTPSGKQMLDIARVTQDVHALAAQGYRVMAMASGTLQLDDDSAFGREHLSGLCFLGLVALIDPLRPEAIDAIRKCHSAGIITSMVTGDHPITAFTIARELGLADDIQQVITGEQLSEAQHVGEDAVDALTARVRVFARVEPRQKLAIVESLTRNGHYVAVTGDGANDAPALHAAHVGVAMGKTGTDVARESGDMIIADDNISSIVAGIEEGRIAYANVRKVIFLLISTGAAEIVLFLLSMFAGTPLPLTAVQLLWLNLVTNGIQDVALAFEPAEGNELKHAPRPPREPIFNRLMIERVLVSAIVMGVCAFAVFHWVLSQGLPVDDARNVTLLLMVLFENVQVFNSRSESLSAFAHNPLRNRLLLFGTATAQLVHIAAMYIPGINDILDISPVSFAHWTQLLLIALTLLVVMELHKLLKKA